MFKKIISFVKEMVENQRYSKRLEVGDKLPPGFRSIVDYEEQAAKFRISKLASSPGLNRRTELVKNITGGINEK
jgi:hypothetical protein